MVIVHHANKMGWNVRGHAQYAYAYRVYFAKHSKGLQRHAAIAAAATGYGLRALLFPVVRRSDPNAARAMRAAFKTALGRKEAPYEEPPASAVRPRGTVSSIRPVCAARARNAPARELIKQS